MAVWAKAPGYTLGDGGCEHQVEVNSLAGFAAEIKMLDVDLLTRKVFERGRIARRRCADLNFMGSLYAMA